VPPSNCASFRAARIAAMIPITRLRDSSIATLGLTMLEPNAKWRNVPESECNIIFVFCSPMNEVGNLLIQPDGSRWNRSDPTMHSGVVIRGMAGLGSTKVGLGGSDCSLRATVAELWVLEPSTDPIPYEGVSFVVSSVSGAHFAGINTDLRRFAPTEAFVFSITYVPN
jgi:hypothetical protein